MPHEIIGPGGMFRMVLDVALRRHLNNLVQQACRGQSKSARQEVLAKLLAHPYLLSDPWLSGQVSDRMQRQKTCVEMLRALQIRLSRGEITQEIPDGTTGQPHLSEEKLSSRPVRMLDVSLDWLLLEIERHPEGGDGMILAQFWLYSRSRRKLWLLGGTRNLFRIRHGEWKVKFGNDGWRAPNTELREDYHAVLRDSLGKGADARFCELTVYQEDLIVNPPPEIVSCIVEITGVNFEQAERKRREALEEKLNRKYGARPQVLPSGLSVDHQAGIYVQYED